MVKPARNSLDDGFRRQRQPDWVRQDSLLLVLGGVVLAPNKRVAIDVCCDYVLRAAVQFTTGKVGLDPNLGQDGEVCLGVECAVLCCCQQTAVLDRSTPDQISLMLRNFHHDN